MVDIKVMDNAGVEVFYACDTDGQPPLWLTFIVQSTRPGKTSQRPLKQRLQELINAAPMMMKKAYEDAWIQYQANLVAWNEGKNPKMPRKPEPPIKPCESFYDVPLAARVEWLQYGDFDDAGIDLLEVCAAGPSDLARQDAHLAVE